MITLTSDDFGSGLALLCAAGKCSGSDVVAVSSVHYGKQHVCRVFSLEMHGKCRTTENCAVNTVCRALFITRTTNNLCRASGMVHDKKKQLTARQF
jgi:hypothetical protein